MVKLANQTLPLLVATGGAIGYTVFLARSAAFTLPATVGAVLGSTVSLASITVGFVLTAASILVAISNTWILRRAREGGAFVGLIRSARSATYSGLLLASFSALLAYFDPSWKLGWYRPLSVIWVFAALYALGTFIRFIRVFFLVLIYVADENIDRN